MGSDSPRSLLTTPVALGALALLLCALVATTFDGAHWTPGPESAEEPSAERDVAGDGTDHASGQEPAESQEGEDERWLPWVPSVDLLLLVPSALVLAVAVFVMARLRVRRRRRHLTGRMGVRRAPPPAAEELPEDEGVGLPEALDDGVRLLGEGAPRNAIVAAWVRLEQAVESEHFRHRPEETPTELVARVVASYDLDGEAIARLAALYREARFSTHPVTEEHRAEAVACLRRLLATIKTVRR